MTHEDGATPGIELSKEHRQQLMAALYRHVLNGGDPSAIDPDQLARLSTLTDEELVGDLRLYEHDDREIEKVLARLGLSQWQLVVKLPCCETQGLECAPRAMRIEVSPAQLSAFEEDHFAVRDMEGFGALMLDLPARDYQAVGFDTEPQDAGAWLVNRTCAVITNGAERQPLVHFMVEYARPGQLDVAVRSVPMPLEELRQRVCETDGDELDLVAELPTERLHWVAGPDLAVGQPDAQRERA